MPNKGRYNNNKQRTKGQTSCFFANQICVSPPKIKITIFYNREIGPAKAQNRPKPIQMYLTN